jgi:hypothetical protein
MAIVSPLTLLIPSGRRRGVSQLQNLFLGACGFWGFNQLVYDYTGKSVYQRSNERWAAVFAPLQLPERARRNKELMDAERARREAALSDDGERAAAEERRRRRERDDAGILGRLMGAEKGWQEKRLEEERKALASGKGYWDLIADQISEVWNGTGKKGEESAAANGQVGEGARKPGEEERPGNKPS